MYGLDVCDFAPLGVLAMGRADMHLSLVLQALCFIKHAEAAQAACYGVPAVRGELDGGNHVAKVIPVSDRLVGNAPQTEFRVEGTSKEKPVVLWVEGNGGDEIVVFEGAETFGAADVP